MELTAPGATNQQIFHIAQRGLYRGEHHVQSNINQIDSGQRNYQAAVDHHSRIQHVVQDLEQRSFAVALLRQRRYLIQISGHAPPQTNTEATGRCSRCAACSAHWLAYCFSTASSFFRSFLRMRNEPCHISPG